MRKYFLLTLVFIFAGFLQGCSAMDAINPFSDDEEKIPLEGERISVISYQQELEPDNAALNAEGFIAPDPWRNEYWPQAGGYPNHAMQNLELPSGKLTKRWSVDIGEGAQDVLPLTAQPIIFDNKIYTLDTEATLRAFNVADSKKLWEKELRPAAEDEEVITGGLAYSSGQLYATSGYNEVFALNPGNGKEIWKVRLKSPSRAAPTVLDGRVYIVTVDNNVLALSEKDGSVLWEYQGLTEQAGLVGMASPAANKDVVIPVFSSGEMYALRVENGSVAWSESLSPLRRFSGIQSIADIRGMPVLDKGMVYAVSYGGKMVALDERTGARVWHREIGSSETPWIAGNHLFVITTSNQVVSLGSDTGAISWVTELPRYLDDKHEKPNVLKGPVLAGGRLIIAGSGGAVYELDPVNGSIINQWSVGQKVVAAPVVAMGTLFLLTADGTLHAYQ